MKFNISTLLLLVTIVALSLGWGIDRYSFWQRQHYLSTGISYAASLNQLFATEAYYQSLPNIQVRQTELVHSIICIHSCVDEIDYAYDWSNGGMGEPSYVLVCQAMDLLGCKSADSFFSLMRKTPGAHGKEWYLDESNSEHQSLRKLIEDALSKPYPKHGLGSVKPVKQKP